VQYRVVDYQSADGEWINTDEGGPEPTDIDIESTSWVNIGWKDTDDNWHYRWVEGPFDKDFWLNDAITEIADEYGITIAAT
jgi:hypothetical protein